MKIENETMNEIDNFHACLGKEGIYVKCSFLLCN
jgi:hypothetical protein